MPTHYSDAGVTPRTNAHAYGTNLPAKKARAVLSKKMPMKRKRMNNGLMPSRMKA